ncbi:uncharacterized protein PRCAT00003672001 [Priceomyces carsonii]|uniref:uncharacterized protein n=1 Tax=Priceomyces carsonii TaxID=28549 RepID=UPI002EDB9959|nr:unnamed protein product [Priceomyces carsonii]
MSRHSTAWNRSHEDGHYGAPRGDSERRNSMLFANDQMSRISDGRRKSSIDDAIASAARASAVTSDRIMSHDAQHYNHAYEYNNYYDFQGQNPTNNGNDDFFDNLVDEALEDNASNGAHEEHEDHSSIEHGNIETSGPNQSKFQTSFNEPNYNSEKVEREYHDVDPKDKPPEHAPIHDIQHQYIGRPGFGHEHYGIDTNFVETYDESRDHKNDVREAHLQTNDKHYDAQDYHHEHSDDISRVDPPTLIGDKRKSELQQYIPEHYDVHAHENLHNFEPSSEILGPREALPRNNLNEEEENGNDSNKFYEDFELNHYDQSRGNSFGPEHRYDTRNTKATDSAAFAMKSTQHEYETEINNQNLSTSSSRAGIPSNTQMNYYENRNQVPEEQSRYGTSPTRFNSDKTLGPGSQSKFRGNLDFLDMDDDLLLDDDFLDEEVDSTTVISKPQDKLISPNVNIESKANFQRHKTDEYEYPDALIVNKVRPAARSGAKYLPGASSPNYTSTASVTSTGPNAQVTEVKQPKNFFEDLPVSMSYQKPAARAAVPPKPLSQHMTQNERGNVPSNSAPPPNLYKPHVMSAQVVPPNISSPSQVTRTVDSYKADLLNQDMEQPPYRSFQQETSLANPYKPKDDEYARKTNYHGPTKLPVPEPHIIKPNTQPQIPYSSGAVPVSNQPRSGQFRHGHHSPSPGGSLPPLTVHSNHYTPVSHGPPTNDYNGASFGHHSYTPTQASQEVQNSPSGQKLHTFPPVMNHQGSVKSYSPSFTNSTVRPHTNNSMTSPYVPNAGPYAPSNSKRTHSRASSLIGAKGKEVNPYAPILSPVQVSGETPDIPRIENHLHAGKINQNRSRGISNPRGNVVGKSHSIHHMDHNGTSLKQRPIFNWSNSYCALLIPDSSTSVFSQRNTVKICSTSNIITDTSTTSFPGPLIKTKTKRKEVEKWLEARLIDESSANADNNHILEAILLNLIKYDADVKSKDFIKGVCSFLNRNVDYYANQQTSFPPVTNVANASKLDTAGVNVLYGLLLSGHIERAVEFTISRGDWAMSLAVASFGGPEMFSKVASDFARFSFPFQKSNNKVHHLMPIVLKACSGAVKSVVDDFTNVSGEGEWANAHWRDIVSSVLISCSPYDTEFLIEFGKYLLANNNVLASDVCFILSGLPLTSVPSSTNAVPFSIIASGTAEHTEIYEYALSLTQSSGGPSQGLPHLLPLKLKHASLLADLGQFATAQKYVDYINGMMKNYGKSSYVSLNFLKEFSNLVVRISESGSTELGWFSGKISKVNLDKVWGQIDKFIGGDDPRSKNMENGVFSKFSPSISRTTSTVDFNNNESMHNYGQQKSKSRTFDKAREPIAATNPTSSDNSLKNSNVISMGKTVHDGKGHFKGQQKQQSKIASPSFPQSGQVGHTGPINPSTSFYMTSLSKYAPSNASSQNVLTTDNMVLSRESSRPPPAIRRANSKYSPKLPNEQTIEPSGQYASLPRYMWPKSDANDQEPNPYEENPAISEDNKRPSIASALSRDDNDADSLHGQVNSPTAQSDISFGYPPDINRTPATLLQYNEANRLFPNTDFVDKNREESHDYPATIQEDSEGRSTNSISHLKSIPNHDSDQKLSSPPLSIQHDNISTQETSKPEESGAQDKDEVNSDSIQKGPFHNGDREPQSDSSSSKIHASHSLNSFKEDDVDVSEPTKIEEERGSKIGKSPVIGMEPSNDMKMNQSSGKDSEVSKETMQTANDQSKAQPDEQITAPPPPPPKVNSASQTTRVNPYAPGSTKAKPKVRKNKYGPSSSTSSEKYKVPNKIKSASSVPSKLDSEERPIDESSDIMKDDEVRREDASSPSPNLVQLTSKHTEKVSTSPNFSPSSTNFAPRKDSESVTEERPLEAKERNGNQITSKEAKPETPLYLNGDFPPSSNGRKSMFNPVQENKGKRDEFDDGGFDDFPIPGSPDYTTRDNSVVVGASGIYTSRLSQSQRSAMYQQYEVEDDTVRDYVPVDEDDEEEEEEEGDGEEEEAKKENTGQLGSSGHKESEKKSKQDKNDKNSGWFKWRPKDDGKPRPTRAKLGNRNHFYWDENLKRWIDSTKPVEEQLKVDEPPPLPKAKKHNENKKMTPSGIKKSSLESEHDAKNSEKSLEKSHSNKNLASAGLDDLINLGGNSHSARRPKRGPRRGYINVMEQK